MFKPVVQKLTAEDVKVAKAFKNIVLQGKFEMRGDAIKLAGSLFAWFDNLDARIEETLKPVPPPSFTMKEVTPVVEEPVVEETKKKAKKAG